MKRIFVFALSAILAIAIVLPAAAHEEHEDPDDAENSLFMNLVLPDNEEAELLQSCTNEVSFLLALFEQFQLWDHIEVEELSPYGLSHDEFHNPQGVLGVDYFLFTEEVEYTVLGPGGSGCHGRQRMCKVGDPGGVRCFWHNPHCTAGSGGGAEAQ